MSPLPSGYAIRPPAFDDVDAVAAVLLADELADVAPPVYDADFVRAWWSSPGSDLAADAWLVVGPDGATVAHASVVPDGDARLKSWGVVHRDHRGLGLGSMLLDLLEARATARLGPVSGGALDHSIDDADDAARAMVLGRGFSFVRSFRHMLIDLDGPRHPGTAPTGIEIRGIDPEEDLARAHAIFVDAFADEWGYREIPFAEWRSLEVDIPAFDPSLWLLATDGDAVVGALSAVAQDGRGWVGELGVRRAWRGRGIGSALLRRTFATFADRGMPRVMLNVDFDNPTGAMRLYERVGMRAVRGYDIFEKPIG